MKKVKQINWKVVLYWFFVMALMNVYIVPQFINHEPITIKRSIIGVIISFMVAFLMGLLTITKTKDK